MILCSQEALCAASADREEAIASEKRLAMYVYESRGAKVSFFSAGERSNKRVALIGVE
jgi:hypothetical protein